MYRGLKRRYVLKQSAKLPPASRCLTVFPPELTLSHCSITFLCLFPLTFPPWTFFPHFNPVIFFTHFFSFSPNYLSMLCSSRKWLIFLCISSPTSSQHIFASSYLLSLSNIFIFTGHTFDTLRTLFSFPSLFHPPFLHLPLHFSCHCNTLYSPLFPFCFLLGFPFLSHTLYPLILSLFYLFFPPLQPCVAVLRGTLCCPQPLSGVLRVLLLWLRLFLSSSTTTTLYYPPLPTSWQVHTLCTTSLPACLFAWRLVWTSVRNRNFVPVV